MVRDSLCFGVNPLFDILHVGSPIPVRNLYRNIVPTQSKPCRDETYYQGRGGLLRISARHEDSYGYGFVECV